MTTIKITTDRLPQPDRHKGAILDVTPEKAASMVAQGFAVIVEEPKAAQPAPEPPASVPVTEDDPAPPAEPEAAPAPAPEGLARRRRTGAAL